MSRRAAGRGFLYLKVNGGWEDWEAQLGPEGLLFWVTGRESEVAGMGCLLFHIL